jgi:hypothetical protein
VRVGGWLASMEGKPMGAPKSREEKVAERRVAWDMQVAGTGANEAGHKRAIGKKEAVHVAVMAAEANMLAAQDHVFRTI